MRLGRTATSGLLIGCAVLVIGLTTAASSPGTPMAFAATVSTRVRVLQMNLCNSGFAGCYTGRSVTAAAAAIRAEAPDVVTLNEVCQNDMALLEKAFADGDHTGATASVFQPALDRRTGAAFRCANGRQYGIGLVTRLPSGSAALISTSGIYPVQDIRDPEERAWVCVDAAGVEACTTHLANSDATVAEAQCRYLFGTAIPGLRARGGPPHAVLGGDLNLQVGGSPDLRSCVPDGDRRADDGGVQNVVATSEFGIASHRAIGMDGTTDHPGLVVTVAYATPRPTSSDAVPTAA
jgi:endonuclease/exonuclease/phosphatase family metal-dependent hydrolase